MRYKEVGFLKTAYVIDIGNSMSETSPGAFGDYRGQNKNVSQ
jgi:hypothetical protein